MIHSQGFKKILILILLAIPWVTLQASTTRSPNCHCNHTNDRHLNNPLLRAENIIKKSPLLKRYKTPKMIFRSQFKTYQVRSANLIRNDVDGKMEGTLILVTRDNGNFVALIDTPLNKGTLIGKSDGTETFIKAKDVDYFKTDYVISPKVIAQDDAEALKHNPKIDENGAYHIEILAGFSQASASRVGDPTAYGLAQVESANLGLRNSRVGNQVILEFAGFEVTPIDYPITTNTLGNLQKIFPNHESADLIAAFFVGNSQDTAAGWAYVPGRVSVQALYAPSAFRHEVGHNAGGNHCNTGQDNFRFGYDNGRNRTFLCGNDSNFYSTPHVTDSYGIPVGNAVTADMARQWVERAPIMSSYGTPIPPVSAAFRLENRMVRGRCLDVLAGEPDRVGVYSCQSNNANQGWVTDDNGRIRLNSNKNLCLGGNGNGNYITLQSCASQNQGILWRESNENYINLSNNECLNPLGNAANSARVNLNPCYNTDYQRWIKIAP